MASLPAYEPQSIVKGDTLKFTKSLPEYSAADGWTLTYTFLGPTKQTVNASADGSNFIVMASTGAWTAGDYAYQATVSKSGETYTISTGILTVQASLSDGTAGSDQRSQTKRILDALIAAFEGRASRTDLQYTISVGGSSRTIQSMPHAELLTAIKQYRQWYAAEQTAERINKGLGTGRKILTRFKA